MKLHILQSTIEDWSMCYNKCFPDSSENQYLTQLSRALLESYCEESE